MRDPGLDRRQSIRAFACIQLIFISIHALANPTAPQVVNGTVTFQQPGASTLSVTNSPGAIINWQGFSIAPGEITRFIQQSGSSSVLNRVVGGDISQLQGQLLSNGRVFLINPNGIVIGPGAIVDTAGFIGSTLNMLDADFLAGKLRFQGDASSGTIINQGWIRTVSGGQVILVAPRIENSGLIHTPGGEIILAAGKSLTIASLDHEGVLFEIQAPTDAAVNVGKLLAEGGAIGVFAGTLKHSGDIRATALASDAAGRIILKGSSEVQLDAGSLLEANGPEGGKISVETNRVLQAAGVIDARGAKGRGGTISLQAGQQLFSSATLNAQGGTRGGEIRALGDEVMLYDASLNASGATGGGTVLVGGDFQGGNPAVRNASRTWINSSTVIRADATQQGDGGKVIVWADNDTRYAGSIFARGGAVSGNGGFIEVSGKEHLKFAGTADASAPGGTPGTLLLDPKNIEVNSNQNLQFTDPPLDFADWAADETGEATVNPAAITAITNTGTAVRLQATNDITVNSPILTNNVRGGIGGALTLQAGRSVNLNANIATDNGNLEIKGNTPLPPNLDFVRDPGNGGINVNNGVTLNAGAGNIILDAGDGGNLSIMGAVVQGLNVTLTAGGRIIQDALGSVRANMLTTTSGAAGTTLPGANEVVNLGATQSGGEVTFHNTQTLNLNAPLMAGGNVVLSAQGTGADLNVAADINLNAGAGAKLELSAGNNIGITGNIASANRLDLALIPTAGMVNWTGGNLSMGLNGGTMTLPAGKTMAIDGAAGSKVLNNVKFNNAGTVNYTSGRLLGQSLQMNNGTAVNNTGVFTYLGAQGVDGLAGTAAFENRGTLQNASAAAVNAFANRGGTVTFNNIGGTLDSGAGLLEIGVGGSHSGTMTLVSNGVRFTGGTHTFTGANFGGTGTLNVAGAAFVLDNTTYDKSISLTGGTVSIPTAATIPATAGIAINHAVGGAGALTNRGTLDLSGGAIAGTLINQGALNVAMANANVDAGLSLQSGAINVAAGRTLTVGGTGLNWQGGALQGTSAASYALAALTFSGTGDRVLDGPTFNIANFNLPGGSLNVQDGALNLTGASSVASGAALMLNGGTFSATGSLANAGTLTKASAGTTSVDASFANTGVVNANAGTLDFAGGYTQNAGGLVLAGGTVLSSGGFTFNGGMLGGGGALTGDVNNVAATVSPGASPGILTIVGNYTQGANGTLNAEIGGTTPGTQYDQLIVTGNATLGGAFNASFLGGFVPVAGDTFNVVQAGGAVSGNFATATGPAGNALVGFYRPSRFDLIAVASALTPGTTIITVDAPGTLRLSSEFIVAEERKLEMAATDLGPATPAEETAAQRALICR